MLPDAVTIPGVIKLAPVTFPEVELLTLPVIFPVTTKLPIVTSAMLAVLATVNVLILATLPVILLITVLPSTVKLVRLPNDVTLG